MLLFVALLACTSGPGTDSDTGDTGSTTPAETVPTCTDGGCTTLSLNGNVGALEPDGSGGVWFLVTGAEPVAEPPDDWEPVNQVEFWLAHLNSSAEIDVLEPIGSAAEVTDIVVGPAGGVVVMGRASRALWLGETATNLGTGVTRDYAGWRRSDGTWAPVHTGPYVPIDVGAVTFAGPDRPLVAAALDGEASLWGQTVQTGTHRTVLVAFTDSGTTTLDYPGDYDADQQYVSQVWVDGDAWYAAELHNGTTIWRVDEGNAWRAMFGDTNGAGWLPSLAVTQSGRIFTGARIGYGQQPLFQGASWVLVDSEERTLPVAPRHDWLGWAVVELGDDGQWKEPVLTDGYELVGGVETAFYLDHPGDGQPDVVQPPGQWCNASVPYGSGACVPEAEASRWKAVDAQGTWWGSRDRELVWRTADPT